MVAIAHFSASAHLQKILLTTAHHFEIRALPDPQLALPDGEFRDPLAFRWLETPGPARPASSGRQQRAPVDGQASCVSQLSGQPVARSMSHQGVKK